MPALHLDSLAASEISDALASGKEVTTHTDQLTVPGFRGSGYAITDAITGDGIYKISGGKNGGYMGIAVGSLAASLIANIVVNGMSAVAISAVFEDALLVVLAGSAGFLAGLMIRDAIQGIKGPVNTLNCFLAGVVFGFTATLGVESAFIPQLGTLGKVLAILGIPITIGSWYLVNPRDCGIGP